MTETAARQNNLVRTRVVFGACLTQFTIIGLLFSYGLFFKVFEAEFGWSRTLLSSCTSLSFILMGTLAIFAGRLNDRYGPRLVLGIAGVIYGTGYFLLSQVSEPWHLFVLFGLFISVGMSTHDVVTLSTIARWFPKRRGVMTGLAKVGTAVGQVAVPPIAAFLILRFGWQSALMVLGSAAALLLVVAALSIANPPAAAKPGDNVEAEGLTFAGARETSTLWKFCAIQFLFFPAMMTVPLHIVVHGMDLGMTAALAAFLLSTMGGASILGRLAVGRSVDKIGGRAAYVLCFVPLIAALLALMFVDAFWMLFVVVAVYGFGHGGLFTVVSPTVAEYFGLRAHGAIFGLILFFGTIGGALGPIFAGWIFDQTGSYFYAFSMLTALAVLGLGIVLLLPRQKSKK